MFEMTTENQNVCLINGVQYKCRTCFDPGRTTHSLTEEASNAKTWREVLKDIAQLQANDDESLPKTLCCKCLEKLKYSYDFVLQIQDVNTKYSELLARDDEVLNEVDNFTDCLAESAIALPLEQYMPDIKLEDEIVASYDIDMSNNKLAEDDNAKLENEDTDDPFTEIYDEDHKSTAERFEDNERSTDESSDDSYDSDSDNTSSYSPSNEDDNEVPSIQPVQLTESQKFSQDKIIKKVDNDSGQGATTVRFGEFIWNKEFLDEVRSKGLLEPSKNTVSDDSSNTEMHSLLFGIRLYSKPRTWRLVQCKLCNRTFKTCKELRQHLEKHIDMDTLHNLKLSDSNVQHLFPNMTDLKLIKETIRKDIRHKLWFKYYTVLNEHSYEMSISDTEEDELEEENAERANKYKCLSCSKTFSFKFQMYLHFRDAHSKKQMTFKCKRCKLEFVSIKMYKQHLDTHCQNKHKNLLCGQCPAKFFWPQNIKDHNCVTKRSVAAPAGPVIVTQYVPSNKVITEDENCVAKTSVSPLVDLEDQLKCNVIETEYKPSIIVMRCALCPQSFKKLRHLRQHMPLHEDGETGIDFENCIYIKKLHASRPINYERVQRQIQNDFRKRQISNFFQAIDKYGNEIEISDSDSDEVDGQTVAAEYRCEICNAIYKNRKYLLKHQKELHKEAEMPLTCWYCGQKYVNIHLLQQHLKRECWNEKRKKGTRCEFCHVRFIWPDNLLIHKEIKHHINAKTSEVEVVTSTGTETPSTDMFQISIDASKSTLISDDAASNIQNISTNLSECESAEIGTTFICSSCDISFSNNSKLTAHMTTQHTGAKLFKCSVCEMAFLKDTDLQSHSLIHLGRNLKDHQRMHNAERPFKCTICEKSFKKHYKLKNHLLTHSHEKPFKCDICDKSFLCSSYLRRHKETMGHTELWWSTPNNNSNSEDLKSETDHKKQRYLCPICGIYLSRNTSVSLHMKTHSGEKPHKCEFCETSFIRKSDLTVHRRIHTAECPYKCPHCEKAFRKRSSLTKHIRVHTGERPYKCAFCNKTFSISTRLRFHERCHTGDKPYKCDVCDQAYACAAYLKKHRITKGHNVEKK